MKTTHSGSLCKKTSNDNKRCMYINPSENQMASMLSILKNGFPSYKIPKNSISSSELFYKLPSFI